MSKAGTLDMQLYVCVCALTSVYAFEYLCRCVRVASWYKWLSR